MEEEQPTKETTVEHPPWKKENNDVIICLSGLLIMLIIILAALAIMGDDDDDDDDDDEEEMMANQAYVDLLAIHVSDELIENQQVVQALAASPDIAPAFTGGSAAEIDAADAVLDSYKATFNVTVVYLMNGTGVTIAATNRDTNGSFVGNNYAFRPYFQDAIAGNLGHYFALGVTSGTRGYYSSFPVKDENGTIVGVAVIKKEIDFLEDSFVSENLCFLVSPDGIIFLSSDDALTMMSLWELDQTTIDALVASNQFGPGPFTNLIKDEPANGNEKEYDGEDITVIRKSVGENDWTLVMFVPEEEEDDDD